ncbi:MAG: HAMP domain-containing sensor histidine kinase [Cyanobacteria bacterium P01_E01_bin.35]
MIESSGSILQLQSRATTLSNVHLLIVSSQTVHFQAIAASLRAAEVEFSYDLFDSQQLDENPPHQKYCAIIYDYSQVSSGATADFLLENIQWWGHLFPDIPLVLVTDVLGDEQAIRLIQSGVSGYVLRHKLYQLPETLEKTLYDFVSKRAIIKQQQDLIKKQQEQIQNLEAERQSWHQQKQSRQEHISHLVHELRNPIAAIIGFARALKEQYYGDLNAKQMQYASLLVGSGEHLLALVKNYLELTKIEANKQILEFERVAVVEICQASTLMVAEKAAAKGLELDFDLEDQIDFCIADSMRLKQILINLLSNAIKFTESGSVKLKITRKQDDLYFAVIDTGVGISAENISKLFRPFPQISNHHENTGLGLTLSKKLAQLHGGDITVTSQLGKGSCFTLCIPQYQTIVEQ